MRLFFALYPHEVTNGKCFVFGNDFLILLVHHNIFSGIFLLICLVLFTLLNVLLDTAKPNFALSYKLCS